MTRIRKVPEQTEYPWKPALESMSVPVPAAIYCNYRAIYSTLGKKKALSDVRNHGCLKDPRVSMAAYA